MASSAGQPFRRREGFRAFDDGPESLAVSYQFDSRVNQGYGNNSTADYFAEAFSWAIYDHSKLPDLQMLAPINLYIQNGAP